MNDKHSSSGAMAPHHKLKLNPFGFMMKAGGPIGGPTCIAVVAIYGMDATVAIVALLALAVWRYPGAAAG